MRWFFNSFKAEAIHINPLKAAEMRWNFVKMR